MNEIEAKTILDKIVGQVFGYQNPLTLEQFQQKFAFDISLPHQVTDSTDGSLTWAQSENPVKFMTQTNARKDPDALTRPRKDLHTLEDILSAWGEINYFTTERQMDSINFAKSDNIDRSENVYHSQDIEAAKNIILCDSVRNSEFIAASQNSGNSTFCIRLEDSGGCSNSFGVSWSGKIVNSIFIHDCFDMKDSMFCTNTNGGQYMIANMQFEKEEYMRLRDIVIGWLLAPPE